MLLTLLAVALRPALYNYPKIVLFVLAIAMMLAYARRPTTTRLASLAGTVATAALYRHDNGVYIGLAAVTLVFLVRGRLEARRTVLALAAMCTVLMLPGIVFAQAHGGFVTYLRGCLEVSRQEASRTAKPGAHFVVDWSQPIVVRRPPPQPPPARFAIRWATTVTPAMRERAEAELQLLQPIRRQDDWNWSYAILSPTPDHVAAIVRDIRVADTDGIDRATFAVAAPPPPRWPRWIEELRRWRIAPGMLRRENAVPWLYIVAWGVVVLAMVFAVWPPFARVVASSNVPRAAVQAVCVLGVLMLFGFLRTANPSRLADVSVPVTILGTWLLNGVVRGSRSYGRTVRYVAATCMTVLLCMTTVAVVVLGEVPHQVNVAGFASANGVQRQFGGLWRDLGALPSVLHGIDENLQRTAAYLRRCTSPTDRLLVADNLPEINYFAERRFAAGQNSFFSKFYSSPVFQRMAIARWDQQSVPIALTQSSRRFEHEFSSDYPLLAEYLRTHYHKVDSLRVEGEIVMDLWIDRRHNFSTDPQTGLPCAQSQSRKTSSLEGAELFPTGGRASPYSE
jgi:hypothetical protein